MGKAEIKAPDLSDSDLSGCQVRLTATAEIKISTEIRDLRFNLLLKHI